MRTWESLCQQVDIMLEQLSDMELLLRYSNIVITDNKNDIIQNMYKRTYLNFKQRKRFLAIIYAKNSSVALENLFRSEL